ncbi:ABC transporter permease [Mucilaginibacter lacusdianchii]|uniref:ABC transporter permease n=1 Tax=Mucilaginibacter lacusdianchii TaxID=2684211 RepID=UPI00131CB309|nr:ABC transporter permease [Mucilaginibacter sp. JXJ CY 39]
MFKNYIKIAWRGLLKNKVYSLINIVGLALGMAVAILIGLWIWDEVSFDRYHDNHDRIAQIMTSQTFNGHRGTHPAVAIPLANELRLKHSADFKHVVLATWNSDYIIAVGDKKISKQGMWVEPGFPEMLTLKMLKGRRNALKDQTSMLLSETVAKVLFNDADPMGKTVRINNQTDMKVAGVYEDIPTNATLHTTQILMPWSKYVDENPYVKSSSTYWGDHSHQLFVQISEQADFNKITAKVKSIPGQYFKAGDEEILLHPMNKWRLQSEFKEGRLVGGRIKFVWLFGIIGVFVLLLACINFMNLSTARSEKRSKEVGIRKAIGSMRQQLIGQFLSESVVMSVLAFVLAMAFVLLFLPFFNSLSEKDIHLPWSNPVFWLLALTFTAITGLVSGSYPAFYLSSFNPVAVLKGTFKAGRFAAVPRKVLVIIQFTVSVTLIIGTIIVFKQVQFAKSRPVGYDREGLITIAMNTPEIRGHYDALRDDLLKTGAVENMAQSSSPSTDIYSNNIGFDWKGKDPGTNPIFGTIAISHDYGKTIGWQIKEGRDFSRSFTTDTSSMLVNEAAVKLIGIKNIIGETIKWNDRPYTVIGVVKDMIMQSPYREMVPTVFMLNYGWSNLITIKMKPSLPVNDALGKVEGVFKKYDPGSSFEYKFTDDEYAQKFSDEERIGNLATFFAVLAIFISALGLFGLASFVAEQRTKEIGVRKVLGASVYNLWSMLSRDFLTLVIISCFIAIPLAWYYLNQWLQGYDYHTSLSGWVFLAAGAGAMVITLLTVSFQAIKAAIANPVKSLRTE